MNTHPNRDNPRRSTPRMARTRSGAPRALRTLLLVALFTFWQPGHAGVGFQSLESNGLVIGVWYPSAGEERAERLGPFDVQLAFDAPVVEHGAFQPVLMSHGNSGRMRNHHLTAKALAQAGFIAIAPTHSIDHLVGGDDTYTAMNWRTEELAHALEAVIQRPDFRRVLDVSRVHAIGYSLGALTALNAAGAGLDGGLIEAHCTSENDPAFCDTPNWFLRQKLRYLRGAEPPRLIREIPKRYFPLPFVTGGVAVVAPVGQGAVFDENLFRARSLFILGFETDHVTVPEFHATYLATHFPKKRVAHYSLRAGHHSAFISPFAKRVTEHDDIDVAKDPEGFDRQVFLDGLNAELVSFFKGLPD